MVNGLRVAAVVAAGGSGRRFGGATPKQLVPLAGTPVLVRTLRVFESCGAVDAVVVAAGRAETGAVRTLCAAHGLSKVTDVVEGGAERQDSVWHALERLRGGGYGLVLVHDAVRPFVDAELILEVCQAAEASGAAIPVLPPVDTVVGLDTGGMVGAVHDRRLLGVVQTPQGFRFDILYEAFSRARKEGFTATDDASLVLRNGGAVRAVRGKPLNFKITTQEDLKIAEIIAAGR